MGPFPVHSANVHEASPLPGAGGPLFPALVPWGARKVLQGGESVTQPEAVRSSPQEAASQERGRVSEPAWGAACGGVEEAGEAVSDLQMAVGVGEVTP